MPFAKGKAKEVGRYTAPPESVPPSSSIINVPPVPRMPKRPMDDGEQRSGGNMRKKSRANLAGESRSASPFIGSDGSMARLPPKPAISGPRR